ncbi:uncharacterized protein ATC70_006555 [Mucor velutinosus]|uniref:Reverse transcriptase domain-containing protein n=1 Tax=Mucor velutinosus TaxID=708070 RepID=A0AAN7DPA1_9FUNG|nr:hypothetical protein ATC70_006555 [Mucor velutinosus]
MEKIHISDDDRIIFAKLTIPAEPDLLPIYVLNIYAPADSSQNRAIFYNSLMNYIKSLDSYGDILERLILAGDSNFQYDLRLPNNAPTKRPAAFVLFTDTFLHDCNNIYSDSLFETLPTFRRGKVIKTLDYIMVGRQLKDLYFDNDIEHVSSVWTDHALLTIKLRLQLNNTDKGLWRANPNLVHCKFYVKKINSGISHFMQTVLANSSDSNQIKWDRLKGYIRKLAKAYCSNRASWRKQRLKDLQSSRNQLIRQLKGDQEVLQQELPKVEKPIAQLEHEIALNATLKAGRLWLDNNKHSVGFLKKTDERRLAQRTMDTITYPTTEAPCTTTADKLEAVRAYYDVLYSPEPSHRYSMDKLLSGIQNTISVDDAEYIISSINMDDILKSARRCPKVSSPGRDGLPYPILHLAMAHPACKELVLAVYNDAHNLGVFPPSWQETCIVLLPRKGDLWNLANWRPISLINTDCKVFTRILNSRVIGAANKVITGHQAGFMPTRFIGDHGLALRLLMEDAQLHSNCAIGVAIDSAKAYDYVNEQYICKMLQKFGFPSTFITSVRNLFFKTKIAINVNGFMTEPVSQKHGLRQGDSISPVLFNFALEPLLLAILNDEKIKGYSIHTAADPRVDVNRLTVASFLQTKMPSAARNLWFRLIHNKVSSKVNVYKIFKLPDDLCVYCGYRETTTHMLFTCPANWDIWTNYFALLFVPLGPLDMSQVATDVLSLDLTSYCLLDSFLKVSTFEAVTCVITAIWRAKWRDHYNSVGFDNQSVMDRAMINLRRISSLNLLS